LPKKYNISESGMDKLMNKLTDIANSNLEEIVKENDDVTGLQESQITTNFIKSITKVKDMQDVIKRNESLSKVYRGLLDMYGFSSMYDMYLYAKSCDLKPEELSKREKKDFSKLVPVKRTVTRNGKEMEITVWEDPNSDEGGEQESGGSEEEQQPQIRHARELNTDIFGGEKETDPKDVAKLKVETKNMPQGNKSFQDNSQFYLSIKGEDGGIVGIIGYSEEGDYLKMDFYRSNGQVSGVATRGFFELMKTASTENKGVKMEDQQEARPVFMQSGLEQQDDGSWEIESEELKNLLGISGEIETESEDKTERST